MIKNLSQFFRESVQFSCCLLVVHSIRVAERLNPFLYSWLLCMERSNRPDVSVDVAPVDRLVASLLSAETGS